MVSGERDRGQGDWIMLACEIKIGNQWTEVDIDAALDSHQGQDMRCLRCNGRVRAHKKYSNGTPAHFEHEQAHKGCSLMDYIFEEPASRHPNALE
jgi:hypothetical protein